MTLRAYIDKRGVHQAGEVVSENTACERVREEDNWLYGELLSRSVKKARDVRRAGPGLSRALCPLQRRELIWK